MSRISSLLVLTFLLVQAQAQIPKEFFRFEYQGVSLHGVLNLPTGREPKGLVMIVHGSGRTNAVQQELHYDVRATLVQAGYGTYMWDKMGCGQSEGTFDYNQPVSSSAEEVLHAIRALQEAEIPGADQIGLWGISRAGWINPIVISRYPGIKFWISVSGVDGKENFKYLLAQNLRIDGLPPDSIQLIVGEWAEGNRICHAGGSYEAYLAATPHLNRNEFLRRFNGGEGNEEGYYAFQRGFMREEFEEATGLQVYIPHFDSLLLQVTCPVLALFGEKDMNVDWTLTRSLYQRTLGVNTDLHIQSFPDGNHNLFQCKTGGFYEFQDDGLPWIRSEGFLEAMANWLEDLTW